MHDKRALSRMLRPRISCIWRKRSRTVPWSKIDSSPLSPVASEDPRDAFALEGQLGPAGGRLLLCLVVRV